MKIKIWRNFFRRPGGVGICTIGIFCFGGCSTAPLNESGVYFDMVEQNSVQVRAYDGMYNVLEARAVLLTRELQTAQLSRRNDFYKLPEIRVKEDREKMLQESSENTKIFLSFYTPDGRYDDLNKAKTIWKIYFEVDGRQFDAKIERFPGTLVEIQSLYPSHTRWSTAYSLTFPVPIESVESRTGKLVITSPLATKELIFKPVKAN